MTNERGNSFNECSGDQIFAVFLQHSSETFTGTANIGGTGSKDKLQQNETQSGAVTYLFH